MIVKLLTEHHLEFLKLKSRLQRLVLQRLNQNVKLLEISCHGSFSMWHRLLLSSVLTPSNGHQDEIL